LTYFLFILGFVVIIYGADWLVKGASSIGAKLNIPDVVIGLTVVALGTSMPELVINIFATVEGDTQLAISNVLGSNIMNILVIVGIAAMINPLDVNRDTTWKEIPFNLFAAILLWILAHDLLFPWGKTNTLSRVDGIIFLSFFVLFMIYSFKLSKNGTHDIPDQAKYTPAIKSVMLILVGFTLLFLGGRWIVNGTVEVAELLGIGNSEVGLVIIASATSLPELVTSIMAAMRKKAGIAIGNAIGSCIFNIFLVLGISALIRPLPFYSNSNYDVMMVVFATVLLFVFVFTGRGRKIVRSDGIMMVIIYIAFIYWRLLW